MPYVVLFSIPGLRRSDVSLMPNLSRTMADGDHSSLVPSFPCVTWPVQANMLTGKLPSEHGVVANGFYWRDQQRVEMWTAGNDKIAAPQIWDHLHKSSSPFSSAVWFPMLSKGCGADYVCMPAPVHNPDGSESLWCYTKPTDLYGDLRDRLGHFPLQHFWGPMAGLASSAWIAESALAAAARFRPNFFYIYLPHLDYAAQRTGPDTEPARRAVLELDNVLGALIEGLRGTLGDEAMLVAASEYAITAVNHVIYPNRLLREAELLRTKEEDGGLVIDFARSHAWALVDHQFAHVFVRDRDPRVVSQVAALFHASRGTRRGLVRKRAGQVPAGPPTKR